ncbi:MAG: PQQ-binding-like beta-propeller repeat protein [Planctomycetes bacterium]|nr:PQQ-binding-like beta-propeller repeat protein [Planctomycetota bacterium]
MSQFKATFRGLPPHVGTPVVRIGVAVLAFALLSACGNQQRARVVDTIAPDPTVRQPIDYYQAQLIELPLRMKYYDLAGAQRSDPVVIREMHVLHDDVRDEILVVDWDRGRHHLWSIDPYDFKLHWRTPIEKRVDYDPLATSKYVFLMNSAGDYQAFDRQSGPRTDESRLVSMGKFGTGVFPSAQPAFNDTHLFVPATNANSMRGLSMLTGPRGVGSESWTFPEVGQAGELNFYQISLRPAADGETVVFNNNNNHLYMVSASDGEFRAAPFLERRSRTPPVIRDDLVFVGSDTGQVFAWLKSGESAFIFNVPGIPYGEIFVQDKWIFVHTMEVYDKRVPNPEGSGTRMVAATRPGKLCAFRYEVQEVETPVLDGEGKPVTDDTGKVRMTKDLPIVKAIDGDPTTRDIIDPIWTLPDMGQEVLMKNGNQLYVLYEEKEKAFTERELSKLRLDGRIVRAEEQWHTTNRQLKILNVNDGKLLRPDWNFNLAEFAFVKGSMWNKDRALYFATQDGYVFRMYASGGSAGGN